MQKQISAQNDNIAKIQSDLQALAERLEKKISDEINDLKNKTLNGLELTVKQLQKDLKNTKYETESQKQNKAEHYFDTERGIQNATMGKDDSKAVDDRKQPYRKQPNKNQVQSEKENIVEVQKSFSKVLAEKDKQYQSLKQKYETLVHEKQDRELKLQSEIEEVTKNLDDTKATYIKQIEGLHEQLKRKEAISLPKLQSAGSEQVKKLQSALNESETQRKLLLQQKEDAESSAVDLQATLNQYKQTLNCLEQTKSEVTKKVEEQKHEINALKQTNLEVTNKMKEQEHKINTLKKQVQEMKRPNENRVHLQCTKGSDGFISQTTLHSPDHNQNGKNSLQSVKVDQVPKTQEEEEPRTSAPLKDQPNGISSKPAETPVAKDPNKENTADVTKHSVTPFGMRKMSITKKPEPAHVKQEATAGGVDSQLQSLFARRAQKNEDPDSLKVFEEKVQERKKIRDSVKQTEDPKYHRQNVGDRGVDSELLAKLEKRKSKITDK